MLGSHHYMGCVLVSMTAPSSSPLDEPPSSALVVGSMPYQKQKHKHKISAEHNPAPVNCAASTPCTALLWLPSQTPCPQLTSQPARSLLSLVTRCPPDTACGWGQLNSHCSPQWVRSLVGHHQSYFHPELSNPETLGQTRPVYMQKRAFN